MLRTAPHIRLRAIAVALAAALLAPAGAASAAEQPDRPGARPQPLLLAQRHVPAPRVHASPRVYWYVPIPFPWYDPWPYHPWRHYPDPWYPYPPRVVTVPSAPPVYIERELGEESPAAGYWYWCDDPPGYYPTVHECPGGWLQVPPRPTDTR